MAPPKGNLAHAMSIDDSATQALLPQSASGDQLAQLLSQSQSNSHSQGLPPITISPLQGAYLAIQAQLIGAKRVLEVGTLGGYSTLWFAGTGAHVTSIEVNSHHRDVALQNTKHFVDKGKVEIILGKALDVLPELHDKGDKFDMVFIDAAWDEQWDYFSWALKMVRKGGCVYVDNVVRAVMEDELEGNVKEGGNLMEKVGSFVNEGEGKGKMEATMISTVSSHKSAKEDSIDGFLIAVVKEEM